MGDRRSHWSSSWVGRGAAPHVLPLPEPTLPRDEAPGRAATFTLPRAGTPTGTSVSPNKFLSEKLSGPGK